MSTDLSVYHKRRVENARKRTDELHNKRLADMDVAEMNMWLVRMETVAADLLNVLTLLELAGDLERAGGAS